MITRRWAAAVVAVVLVGCGPAQSAPPTTPVSPSVSPTPTPTPTITPLPDTELPLRFPIDGALVDHAAEVVQRLHDVAAGLPVLKVDVTRQQATLTALLPDKSVRSYSWRGGQITRVDSDIQYLRQATFDPADYPIDSVGRMFDVADLRGVRGELVLQVVEYRDGQVLMTVTSRPETTTVFFRKDGTAVTTLGYTSVADITAGLDEVVGGGTALYSIGFNPTRGYWADLTDDEPGVVLSRSRVGGVPVFETRRSETPGVATFSPDLLKPAALAQAITRYQTDPTQACTVVVDMSTGRWAPVARYDCAGAIHYTDMAGRDMTDLIAPS
ncbi:MAG: hypothetical protein IPJ61_01130 [Tessaracoccus sp.]|uniref:hypothetical protein n=1 Tax=Tessaracoccus sp. TaxID=1971211 RepID=UPI001EB0E1C8|nr:hypothetical protein [Tessaracoccus sp.]MBK7819698.1 hypothetical protein [Tessaracoccus sp.]